MAKTKLQRINPKQIKQFFADAQKRAATARKNLVIDAETAYEIAYEAMKRMIATEFKLDRPPEPFQVILPGTPIKRTRPLCPYPRWRSTKEQAALMRPQASSARWQVGKRARSW
jgi:hypothetical protein